MNAISKFAMAFVLTSTAMAAHAASAVKATPAAEHPTGAITVSGSAFGDLEAVDVYLDTVDTLLLVSTATGTFSGSVTIPATASPGTHYLTAIGRKSGDAAQVAITVTTAWAQIGFGSAHLGWNPYENTLNTGNVTELGSLWTVQTGSAWTNYVDAAPSIVNGRVYVAGPNNAGVQALNAVTGAVEWTSSIGPVFGSPTVSNGVVYAVNYVNPTSLYALNVATGATIWSLTIGTYGMIGSPVVSNGIVYVYSYNTVTAVSTSTHKALWTYSTGDGYDIESSVVVANGVLYFGSDNQNLYALNATTGALLWSFPTGYEVVGSPVVANGKVIIGSYTGTVYALSAGAAGGQVVWSYTGGDAFYNGAAVANGVVYVAGVGGNLYALNLRTGVLEWSLLVGEYPSPPIVANGMIFIGYDSGSTTGSELMAVDIYGDQLIAAHVPVGIWSSAAVSDGVVYFNDMSGYTYAYALQAGANVIARPLEAPSPFSLRPNLRLPVSPNLSQSEVRENQTIEDGTD